MPVSSSYQDRSLHCSPVYCLITKGGSSLVPPAVLSISLQLKASSMSTVQLSYLTLLREVCDQLQIETPQCVVTPAAEGTYLAYIDLPVPRNESIVEIVRCWGTQSSTSAASQQDAARLTIKRIVEEFDLQLKDINYDESIFHQNLYNELSTNHAVLFARYNNLLKEYNFLKLKNAMAETDAPVG
ncbi:uncharacterized protein LOC109728617 isoform X1 [Ananas comosus]|uniref:Uncharacterized protein LOC109728617 isoform X1 n=1 Tax=Ananas comosus TaxID=4615 RepID=A0A6P5HMY5_ANACO|nr:uncharacterized protein LOC109728617 isoform X1 [Ananas comosus]